MLTISFLYRSLSAAAVGVYVFFMMLLVLVETLKSGFLTTAFIKFYSGTKKERADEITGSAWSLALIISAILVLVNLFTYYISFYTKNLGLVLFLKYFSLISLSSLPSFMANLVVQGDKRFDRLLKLRLVNQVLFTTSVVALIIFKKATLGSMILTYGLCSLIASIIIIFLGWAKIRSIKYSSKKACWELFHFGKYSMGTSLSSNLFSVTDAFFINFFLGPSALAIYNLGSKLLQIVEIPLLSFAASGMPGLAAYFNNNQNQEMMHLMKKLVGMLTIAIITVALFSIVFAEPIIALVGGSKYIHTEAPNLFRIFMCLAIIYPTDRFFALTLDVIHKPKINFYKIIAMLTANLIADYVGLKISLSVYVIVIANIFPLIVAVSMSYFHLNKFLKFNFLSTYITGYQETVLLVKQFYYNIFNKKPAAINN